MEMKADPTQVLMSDVLRGSVPELEGETAPAANHVVVIADRITNGGTKRDALVGVLRGILFDVDPEIEFRIALEEAMNIVQAPGLSFGGFELHHGERIIPMPGPFVVKAARIDDINVPDQLCTLSLHLKKQAR